MSLRGQELAHLHGCAFSDQLQMELQRIQINLTSRTYSGYPTMPADNQSHWSAGLSLAQMPAIILLIAFVHNRWYFNARAWILTWI